VQARLRHQAGEHDEVTTALAGYALRVAQVAAAAAVLLDRKLTGRRTAPSTTTWYTRQQPNPAPA